MAKSKKPLTRSAVKKATPKKKGGDSTAKRAVPKKAAVKKKLSPAKKQGAAKLARPKRPAGEPEALRDEILKILDDRQGEDIVTFDLAGRSPIADYLIIASGRSGRQVAAMAGYLREACLKRGLKNVRIEGMSEGDWVLVDAGDVIVHLFRPEVRQYYDLETIWDRSRGAGGSKLLATGDE
ncbi:MAG: ribosome silencing factor [Pseudomonadota bacterium]|nr:ribosome silencing factor [Pseudomonadota bacterium]